MASLIIDAAHGNVIVALHGLNDPASSVIRNAPQRGRWSGNVWTCEATARTLEFFRDKGTWSAPAAEMLAAYDGSRHLAGATAPRAEPIDFAFKTKPYAHQMAAFKRFRDKKASALYLEQGLGKSKVAIDKAAWLFAKDEIIGLVILAWPNGVHRNWIVNEVPAHMPDWVKWRACTWNAKSTSKKWIKENITPVMKPESGVLDIFAANIDGVVSPRLVNALEAFIAAHGGRVMIVVDEVTRCKTPGAKTTKIIIKLAKRCAHRMACTGWPLPKSPLDLYSQFNVIDEDILGFESFWSFRSRYAIMKPLWGKTDRRGKQIEVVDGYKNLNKLQEMIAPHYIRALKSECLDLPPKIYKRIYHEITDKQRKVYEDMRDKLQAELREPCSACGGQGTLCPECCGLGYKPVLMTTPMAMTKMMRLHAVVMNIFKPDGEGEARAIEEGTHPRLRALVDWCDNQPKKAIIWATYRHSLREIRTILTPERCAAYWGETPEDERADELMRFKTDPRCQFIDAHPRSLGFGHTILEAKAMLYYSNGFSLEQRLQSEDRPHRIGQDESVAITDLECEGTIDTKVIATLRDRRDVSRQMLGDKLGEWI